MNLSEAKQKLESIGQLHILKYHEHLSEDEKHSLLKEIDALDLNLFREQQKMLTEHKKIPEVSPYGKYANSGNSEDRTRGKELITEGKAGGLIIAGGQATRLKWDAPKGTFPITPIRKKSLFQLFAEKTLAASQAAGRSLSFAIMVSPENQKQTMDFFDEHQNFGIIPDFFTQANLPLLTPEGNLFLDLPHRIAKGPDGNGFALSRFYHSDLYTHWQNQGIEYVNMVLIDNPLADPFDAELIGFHDRTNADVVIKAIKRHDPNEKVGVIAQQENKTCIVEYSELPPDPELQFPLANISLFSFSMSFIRKVAETSLPLHLAFKAVPALGEDGKPHRPEKPNAYKFERFIFDVLPHADKVETLVYPREECFAPLKNNSGAASPESVREALLQRDRQIFKQVTDREPPNRPFELSQEFYYPTPAFSERWKTRPTPDSDYFE